jgi:hypothetical protein
VSGWVLWAVLVLTFVLVKANRSRRALLILIPLLILSLLWLGFKKVMAIPTSAEVIFDPTIYSLIVSIAVVFLLGHKFGGRNRFVTFLLTLGVMAAVLTISFISNFGTEFFRESLAVVIIFALLALPMLLGVVLTGWRCRKRYSSLRFMLWLAVWVLVVSATFMLTYLGIMVISSGIGISSGQLTIMFLTYSLVISVFSYVILLPYMILAFRSGFFRERLYALLHLESMSGSAEAEADSNKVEEGDLAVEKPENDNFA